MSHIIYSLMMFPAEAIWKINFVIIQQTWANSHEKYNMIIDINPSITEFIFKIVIYYYYCSWGGAAWATVHVFRGQLYKVSSLYFYVSFRGQTRWSVKPVDQVYLHTGPSHLSSIMTSVRWIIDKHLTQIKSYKNP